VYLNDGVLIPEMKEMLVSDNESMAYAILHSSNGLFTQEKIAMLFSKDKSTISRWLNKNKEKSHE
ncbi:hypothetical protein ER539_07995, partial [Salmonella enterica]|nr:hypothetical protein [Salmonella enterica]